MPSYEHNCESVIITLLQAQSALSALNTASGIVHFDTQAQTSATSIDRITVKASPREPELIGPRGEPVMYAVNVEVAVILATNNVTTLETYIDAIQAATTGQVASISAANPTVITTVRPHGFGTSGTLALTVAQSVGGSASINGAHTATLTGASTFTLPVNVTSAGTGGSFAPTSFITQCASLFPNGGPLLYDTPDGTHEAGDSDRTRSKLFRLVFNA
jgi:hypothetical protein